MGHHGPEYLWQTKRLFKNDNSIQFLGQSHRASHARRIDQLQPQTTNSTDNETTPAGIKPLHSPKVTVRFGFTNSFIIGHFFLEMCGKLLR
ncbi:hypothetical protein AVEN_244964-1 [Araneus ventricosus]|uniref:Uncharacterized protein n=1 Tax=Araneus ventricosus TaxID=182803 RepID=A0A4Y2NR97_ARAVE|nr:hypothetical protein AVEN_244964-1 [Araneus ventricosus]